MKLAEYSLSMDADRVYCFVLNQDKADSIDYVFLFMWYILIGFIHSISVVDAIHSTVGTADIVTGFISFVCVSGTQVIARFLDTGWVYCW